MPRKHSSLGLIGCNVRAGQPRGGMTASIRQGPRKNHSSKHHDENRAIIEAASLALERRGLFTRVMPMAQRIDLEAAEGRERKGQLT